MKHLKEFSILALGMILGTFWTLGTQKDTKKVQTPVVVQAPPPPVKQNIPYGLSLGKAIQYSKQPDIITTYVWVGYQNSNSPDQQVETSWPHFGKILNQESCGALVLQGGALVRVTVQKDDCWKRNF